MPGVAPIGYINNKNTKRIVLDRRVAPKITQAFELYARGDKTMSEIAQFFMTMVSRRTDAITSAKVR